MFLRNSYNSPCTLLVPDFTEIDVIPPPKRPYCASYKFDCTVTSCVPLNVGTSDTPRLTLVSAMPSTNVSFSPDLPPLIDTPLMSP